MAPKHAQKWLFPIDAVLCFVEGVAQHPWRSEAQIEKSGTRTPRAFCAVGWLGSVTAKLHDGRRILSQAD